MVTIATMTSDGDTRTDARSPSTTPAPARAQPQPAQTHDPGTAIASRPLLVPVLTTVTATLIAGVFLLALAGFNILRDDMSTLRAEVKTEIGVLRDDMSVMRDDMSVLRTEMNDGFERVGSVLLDHADRLARIETRLDIHPAAEPTSAPEP